MLTEKISWGKQTGHKSSLRTPPELYLCQIQQTEYTRVRYQTMNELLRMIAYSVSEQKIPLVFVIAPSSFQVYDEHWSYVLKKYGRKSEHYRKSLPNEKLMQFAQQNSLLMLDLLPILQSEANKGKQLYNFKEQHWNRAGNRVVAYALLDYLKSKSLLNLKQLNASDH